LREATPSDKKVQRYCLRESSASSNQLEEDISLPKKASRVPYYGDRQVYKTPGSNQLIKQMTESSDYENYGLKQQRNNVSHSY
jgi:hypothetical protein